MPHSPARHAELEADCKSMLSIHTAADLERRGTRGADAATVADEVRAFYERHPYPPPIDNLDQYRQRWDDQHRRRAESYLFWPDAPNRQDRSVLGRRLRHVTGGQIRAAMASRTGDRHRRQHDEHRENRSAKAQVQPRQPRSSGFHFDHIVCTGVLHHLPDPDAGLRSLRDVLAPSGAMHLMVYAPYGRAGVYLLQAYCRELGTGTSAQEIKHLAMSLKALPRDRYGSTAAR
jgi:SAM-dependent methyltransferase